MSALAIFFTAAPFVIALLLGMAGPFGIFFLFYAAKNWSTTTKLVIIFWAVTLGAVLQVVLTTRILNLKILETTMTRLTIDDVSSGFMASRLLTLFLIGFSLAEGLRGYLASRNSKVKDPASAIIQAFLAYLIGIMIIGVTGATEQNFSHKFLYVPVVLVALYHLARFDLARLGWHMKLMLLVPVLSSLAAAVIAPDFALLRPYAGIPGIDFRLYGVATHANTLGSIALLLLMFEIYFPSQPWLRRVILISGIAVFFLAQSKTAWIAAAGIFVLVFVPYQIARSADIVVRRRIALLLGIALIITLSVAVIAIVASVTTETWLDDRELTSFTGRTSIWAITFDEFLKNPLFGYGPDLWGIEYRYKLDMLYVGQAHNQFIHTLGKSGAIGITLLITYLVVLLRCAIRYFRESRGLVLALVLFVLFRCITEAPLENGVILEWAFFTHGLMIVLATYYARAGVNSQVEEQKERDYSEQGIFYARG